MTLNTGERHGRASCNMDTSCHNATHTPDATLSFNETVVRSETVASCNESIAPIFSRPYVSSDPESVELGFHSWLDAAKFEQSILGAIVRNPKKPTNDYLPENPLQYYDKDQLFVEGTFEDVVANSTKSTSYDFCFSLKSLAGFEFKGSTSENVHLSGKRGCWKRLQQHQRYWDKLKDDPDVQSTALAWVKDDRWSPPYLVVGIMICEDIVVGIDANKENEATARVSVPIPGPPGVIIDPDIGDRYNHKNSDGFSAKVPGSRIFALELRKVAKEWFGNQLRLGIKDSSYGDA